MHSFILLPIHSSINDMGSDNAKISISCFLVEIVQGGGSIRNLTSAPVEPCVVQVYYITHRYAHHLPALGIKS